MFRSTWLTILVGALVVGAGAAGLAFAADNQSDLGSIVTSKPAYVSKGDNAAWKERGRIVGAVRDCPGGEVQALDAQGQVVKSFALTPGGKGYELEWLNPGVYTLQVSAAGFQPLMLKDLEVRAGGDLRIVLEFVGGAGAKAKAIAAGRPVYRSKGDHPSWKNRGRIVGATRGCPGGEVTVLDSQGKAVKSFAVKPKAKGYELGWLSPGVYTLQVKAEGCDPLVLKDLAVKAGHDLSLDLEFTGGAAGKTIEAGRPRRIAKGDHPAWKERGRIVGAIQNSPGCQVQALDAQGRAVTSFTVKRGGKGYELEWLNPGVYTLRVSADGYAPLVRKNLEVGAGRDLRIDLEF